MNIDKITVWDFPRKKIIPNGYVNSYGPTNDDENIQFLTDKINELIVEINRLNMKTDIEDAKFED